MEYQGLQHSILEDSSIAVIPNAGAVNALAIAFNDLKRRYIQRQCELSELNAINSKMSLEISESTSTTHLLERKLDQLQKSLQSKISAYANLEETYKQTREHEDSLIEHSSETEKLLDQTLAKLTQSNLEKQILKEDYNKLKENLSRVLREKTQLEEELQHLKLIPEITIHKAPSKHTSTSPPLSICNCSNQKGHLEKRIQDLISENQALKTNVHWLSVELKNQKDVKVINRVRRDSESLEVGKKQDAVENNNLDRCEISQSSSKEIIVNQTQRLHKIVCFLRKSLEENTKLIQKLQITNHSHGENLHTNSKSCQSENARDYVNEPASVLSPGDRRVFSCETTNNELSQRAFPLISHNCDEEFDIVEQLPNINLSPSVLLTAQEEQTLIYLRTQTPVVPDVFEGRQTTEHF